MLTDVSEELAASIIRAKAKAILTCGLFASCCLNGVTAVAIAIALESSAVPSLFKTSITTS
jgi:hypothetical protein